jgi:WhiB family redox-sensing transcriptional regulator
MWDLFYGPGGEYRFDHEKREAEAKAVCAGCPVRLPCAEAGAYEPFGVWGGLGEAERRVTRRSFTNADFAGVAVTSLRLVPVVARLAAGVKHCRRCGEDKPLGDFGKAAGKADGLTAWCRECTNAYVRDRNAALRAAPATGPEVALMNALNWRDRAACRSVSPELFFSPDHQERPAAREMRERSARRVCASCPVTAVCLAWANTTGDMFSISGGLTPEERLDVQYAAAGRQQSANTARARKARRRRAAIEAAGEKRCTGPCGRMKPLDDFSIAGHWLRGDCNECRNARCRAKARQQRQEAAQREERETA